MIDFSDLPCRIDAQHIGQAYIQEDQVAVLFVVEEQLSACVIDLNGIGKAPVLAPVPLQKTDQLIAVRLFVFKDPDPQHSFTSFSRGGMVIKIPVL